MTTREEAMSTYRRAWASWCLAASRETKEPYERVMDEMQPLIARSPADPRWREFTATLPGFDDFWENWRRKIEKQVEARIVDDGS